MKKSSKKRILCELCRGKGSLKIKIDKKYRTVDLCPLCDGKGYLLIIKKEKT